MLFNAGGDIVAQAQAEHAQIYPRPGWVEHDPLEIWQCTQRVVEEALRRSGARATDIASVGIANQRETAVVWNKKTGEPLCNAIVWQDTRTDKICNDLASAEGMDRFRSVVGLPVATYFSAPKIKWILDNVTGAREAAERGDAVFGTIDTWLIWNLTGGVNGGSHVTDVTNASRTMLMSLEECDWSDEMASIFEVPLGMLPEIRPSSDSASYGLTTADGPFGGRIPVCGDLGDQQAAMLGQANLDVGDTKNTYGTGCFMLMNTGTRIVPSRNGLLATACYKFDDQPTTYALEGSIAVTGALVQWLRDNLQLIDSAAEVEELAKTVDDNGGIYFVPAFSGLFAPHWRSDARGAILGMTRFVNRGHISRAVLEATAYQTREILEAMRADSGLELRDMKVDGGMVQNALLMQIQADVLGVPVTRPKVAETTALGAAYAAGLAVGFWKGPDDIRANWCLDTTWQPREGSPLYGKNFIEWQKAVSRTLNWVDE